MSDSPNSPLGLTFEQALDLLEHGTLKGAYGLLPWGSNYTFLVEIVGSDLQVRAVYKPQRGERPLWDFEEGTLCLRERAAFLVSEALNWRIVPPTVLREGPLGFGSVQLFIPHDPEAHYFTFGPEQRPQVQRIALLDHVINNADRKSGHCLLDKSGRIWAIDHGVCFHAQPKLRTVIWEFAGKKIPRLLLDDLRRLCEQLDGGDLCQRMSDLLDAREVEALRRRTASLVSTGVYPQPGPERSYPWPPV